MTSRGLERRALAYELRDREHWLELPDRDVPAARAFQRELGVVAVASVVCAEFGVSAESLRERGRHSEARAAVVYLCRKHTPASVASLGGWFGRVGPSAISKAGRPVGVWPSGSAATGAWRPASGAVTEPSTKCQMSRPDPRRLNMDA